MATGYLDNHKEPTPQFNAMVEGILASFWVAYRPLQPQASGFIVPAVMDGDSHVSYWGIIDTKGIPEEDLYIELWRRFLSAVDQVGERNIRGFGLVDIETVLSRAPTSNLTRLY